MRCPQNQDWTGPDWITYQITDWITDRITDQITVKKKKQSFKEKNPKNQIVYEIVIVGDWA